MTERHIPLQQHLQNNDELLSIYYSDRYLCSPWTVILIAELIDGLKQILQTSWNNPKLHIDSAPKSTRDSYQKHGLFADWLDDSLRLAVMEAYFAAMDETCAAEISIDTQHGRIMQLNWRSGKVTTLRFDQGVGYWGCDVKPPYFDNLASALEQAEDMMSIVSELKIRNHKDFPTQVFIKER